MMVGVLLGIAEMSDGIVRILSNILTTLRLVSSKPDIPPIKTSMSYLSSFVRIGKLKGVQPRVK
jgi:hypothetical protein